MFFGWTNKRLIFSVKKKENKYLYFKIRNFVKLANHRMTYIRHYMRRLLNYGKFALEVKPEKMFSPEIRQETFTA